MVLLEGSPPSLCRLPANAGGTANIIVFVEVNQLCDFSCLVVTLVGSLRLIFSLRLPALVGSQWFAMNKRHVGSI